VGDDGGADRNAANRARFEQLPAAGSREYWAALEDTAKATRLELEILAMCARERLAAGRRDQFDRILGIIWDRIQRSVRQQIERSTPSGARDRARVIEDIMQECMIGLWRELASAGPTFLTQGFWRKLRFIVANTITQRHIAEGIKTREDTVNPNRVPQGEIGSLDQPTGPEDDSPLGDKIPNPQANDSFSLAELATDIKKLMEGLTAEQRLLLWNEWTRTFTQKELGDLLGGITDRAVRLRLKALQAWLRAQRDAPDTPPQPPQAPGEDGGSAGGEERQS
jgi:RNA polymerase sigma factor (sigma-70 family)